jgi:hypothetical protein
VFTVTTVNAQDALTKLNKGLQGNLSIEHETLMSLPPYNSYHRERLTEANLVSKLPTKPG